MISHTPNPSQEGKYIVFLPINEQAYPVKIKFKGMKK